jgi:hypothetical protein
MWIDEQCRMVINPETSYRSALHDRDSIFAGRGRGRILSQLSCPQGINANWGRKLPLAGNDAIAVLNESAIS